MGLEGFFSKKEKVVVTQETKAGVFPVSIEFTSDGDVARVMMAQDKPVLKDIYLDISEIANSLRIKADEIDDSFPVQKASTGLFTLPICVKSFNILKSMEPDFLKIKNICKKLGVGSFHVFTFDTLEPSSLYHVRNFPPLYGVNEDPVTGTANGAVCSYLLKNNIIQKTEMVCEQGDVIGRSGRVFVEIKDDNVQVGGRAVVAEERELTL
jgi:PhzF family phenazine biosynthesis protein